MKLDVNNHSVSLYPFVLAMKYRRQVIDDEYLTIIKSLLKDFQNRITYIVESNHDKDYSHIMFKDQPKLPQCL